METILKGIKRKLLPVGMRVLICIKIVLIGFSPTLQLILSNY